MLPYEETGVVLKRVKAYFSLNSVRNVRYRYVFRDELLGTSVEHFLQFIALRHVRSMVLRLVSRIAARSLWSSGQ